MRCMIYPLGLRDKRHTWLRYRAPFRVLLPGWAMRLANRSRYV